MIPDFSGTPLARLWSLEGRVAVVTGGGSGMGQATALRLAEAGAATVVADIDAGRARQTVDLISEHTPGAVAVPLAVDVADPASVHALGDAVTERLGHVDIWVNTAWLSSSGAIADYPDEMWRQGLAVNLDGSFYIAREAARRMLQAGRRGVIILVTSGSAHHGRARRYQYVAAKHGTLGLVKSLALELGPAGIRVVAIAPAATDTPGFRVAPTRFDGADAEQAKRLLDDTVAKMALGRLGQADDIARAAVFAASDMAGFVTGSTIHVDGGVDAA
ncbi:MAG TPA: SDR family oxidoreductase [Streptosporangiaceae bacterium]|jgi:NAD(P)-dependent dehydrogenase (short-subunit alcohol dehydrogenase family)|nr:SDR family oxidoreductase [Streptosporangiaceae bacterium]